MTQAAILAASGSPGTTTGFKNRIINGNMAIDQRNAGASVTPSGGVTLDRWYVRTDTGTSNAAQQVTTAPAGFSNSLKFTTGTGASPSSGAVNWIYQIIEGYNTADLGWGTANAQTVTLSFWVQSSVTGTYSGNLANSDYSRSYPFTFTISAANTWTKASVTIPGDTSGTWLTTNGRGVYVSFNLGMGSTYTGPANAWASALYGGVTGTTNIVATSGATFYLTGVQFEVGTTATNFDFRSYGTELNLCQRYYEKSYNVGTAPATATALGQHTSFANYGVSTTNYIDSGSAYFKVSKRTNPTVSVWDLSGNSGKCTRYSLGIGQTTNESITLGNVNENNFETYSTGGNYQGIAFQWAAVAEL